MAALLIMSLIRVIFFPKPSLALEKALTDSDFHHHHDRKTTAPTLKQDGGNRGDFKMADIGKNVGKLAWQ